MSSSVDNSSQSVLYSLASEANSAVQPGRKLVCSADNGWRSALFEVWKQPGNIEEFTTKATPDQLIVLTSAGQYDIESYAQGSWRAARYRPGNGGATAPLNVSRLRWRSSESATITTLHLYLPQGFLSEAAEEYRRAGASFVSTPVDFLSMEDVYVFETLRALARAAEFDAPDLYCDAACRMLATHLLLAGGKIKERDISRDIGSDLTDRRLSRVVEFMQTHASEALSLDQLAKEAGISRFHFVRLFKRKLGFPPHEYLVTLRLQRAAELLRTTDLDVTSVANSCGYPHPGRFAKAFRKAFSINPSNFRKNRE